MEQDAALRGQTARVRGQGMESFPHCPLRDLRPPSPSRELPSFRRRRRRRSRRGMRARRWSALLDVVGRLTPPSRLPFPRGGRGRRSGEGGGGRRLGVWVFSVEHWHGILALFPKSALCSVRQRIPVHTSVMVSSSCLCIQQLFV